MTRYSPGRRAGTNGAWPLGRTTVTRRCAESGGPSAELRRCLSVDYVDAFARRSSKRSARRQAVAQAWLKIERSCRASAGPRTRRAPIRPWAEDPAPATCDASRHAVGGANGRRRRAPQTARQSNRKLRLPPLAQQRRFQLRQRRLAGLDAVEHRPRLPHQLRGIRILAACRARPRPRPRSPAAAAAPAAPRTAARRSASAWSAWPPGRPRSSAGSPARSASISGCASRTPAPDCPAGTGRSRRGARPQMLRGVSELLIVEGLLVMVVCRASISFGAGRAAFLRLSARQALRSARRNRFSRHSSHGQVPSGLSLSFPLQGSW